MYRNTLGQKIAVFAFDTSTGAAKTGDAANITLYVSKDGGAVTTLTDTSASEMDATNAKGMYLFDVSQTETDAVILDFTGKSSTANVQIVPVKIKTEPPYFSSMVIDSSGRVDVSKIGGTAQTPRDIGASVLLSSGTGTGQLDISSGVVKANLAQILGTALTETAGLIAAGFKKFFNVSTPTGTVNSLPDAVAGATGGVAIVGSNMGTVSSVTNPVALTTAYDAAKDAASQASVDALGSPLQSGDYDAPRNDVLEVLDTMLEYTGTHSRYKDTALEQAPGGSAPTVQDIVDGVYDELLSGHTVAGSGAEAWATAGSGGIPPSTQDQIDAIEAIVTALQASAVLVQSNTIGSGGTVRMFYGLDYKHVDGRAVSWINEAGSWPDLTGATISVLDFDTRANLGGTGTVVTPTGVNQTVRWEVTKTVFTAAASKKYILKATLSNGDEIDLTEGSLLIR